jgi:hypothetical protein
MAMSISAMRYKVRCLSHALLRWSSCTAPCPLPTTAYPPKPDFRQVAHFVCQQVQSGDMTVFALTREIRGLGGEPAQVYICAERAASTSDALTGPVLMV